jgi:hypothetical protein
MAGRGQRAQKQKSGVSEVWKNRLHLVEVTVVLEDWAKGAKELKGKMGSRYCAKSSLN